MYVNTLDMTRLSNSYANVLQNGEIAKLRKVLEQERIARKQQRAATGANIKSTNDLLHFDRSNVTRDVVDPNVQRKSSMKDLTGKVEDRVNTTVHSLQGPRNVSISKLQ